MRQLNEKEYCKKVMDFMKEEGLILTVALVSSNFNWKNVLVRIELLSNSPVHGVYILTTQTFESEDPEDLVHIPEIDIYLCDKTEELIQCIVNIGSISQEDQQSLINQMESYCSKYLNYLIKGMDDAKNNQ